MNRKMTYAVIYMGAALTMMGCAGTTDDTETNVESETETEASEPISLYSDDYVEIELVSIESDNVYFNITNVSDETIQVNANYIQLDGTTYTYEDTNYSTPMDAIVSGDTRYYQFCDYDLGNEVDLEITETDCKVFSGMFEIWDEDGNLIENAGIPDVSLE